MKEGLLWGYQMKQKEHLHLPATEGNGHISPGRGFQIFGAITKKALSCVPTCLISESTNSQSRKMTVMVGWVYLFIYLF